MPALSCSAIVTTSDGFEIQTRRFGVLRVALSVNGNVVTATVFRDGVQKTQTNFNTSQLAQLESQCNTALNNEIEKVGGEQEFYVALHVRQLTPLIVQVICSASPVIGEWWNG